MQGNPNSADSQPAFSTLFWSSLHSQKGLKHGEFLMGILSLPVAIGA
jgi:hypothetical protein